MIATDASVYVAATGVLARETSRPGRFEPKQADKTTHREYALSIVFQHWPLHSHFPCCTVSGTAAHIGPKPFSLTAPLHV